MKRVIEKGNLAFNHMIDICSICKRCNGKFTDNDEIICKYNKDNKGLKSGLVRNYMQNYKCKYYKRHSQYRTCKLQMKNYKISKNRVTKSIVFKRGKFVTSKI